MAFPAKNKIFNNDQVQLTIQWNPGREIKSGDDGHNNIQGGKNNTRGDTSFITSLNTRDTK